VNTIDAQMAIAVKKFPLPFGRVEQDELKAGESN
jgi:hypothetical protein